MVVADSGERRKMVPEQVLDIESVGIGLGFEIRRVCWDWGYVFGSHVGAEDDVGDCLYAGDKWERGTVWVVRGWGGEGHAG